MNPSTLLSKQQSSITIALVGEYACIPGLSYSRSQVISGYETINTTDLFWISPDDNWSCGGWWYWNQFGATAAIEAINQNPYLLPNTTIKIKRFNQYASWNPVQWTVNYESGGVAMVTAMEIKARHPDVVAVIGGLYSTTTARAAQVYSSLKIPYCSPATQALQVLNKDEYPTFIQTSQLSGLGNGFSLLLKSWNVKRIAVLATTLFDSDSTGCKRIMSSFRENEIEIVAQIQQASYINAENIAQVLKQADAKYILACGRDEDIGDLYLTLATQYGLVNSKHVWMSTNPPNPSYSRQKSFGNDYAKYFQGVILQAQAIGSLTKTMESVSDYLANSTQAALKFAPARYQATFQYLSIYQTDMRGAYDCAGLLATEFHKRLTAADSSLFSSSAADKLTKFKEIQYSTDYKSFLSLNYSGASGDPLRLTDKGDLLALFTFGYLTNDSAFIVFGRTDDMVTQFIHKKPIVFYGGGIIPPPDSLPQIFDIVDAASMQWAIIISLTAIGCIMCAALFSFNISFQKHSAVKAASVMFSSFMTVGSLMVIISNLAYLGEPSVWAEKVKFFLQWMGIGTIMAGMISKNARVCIIYRMGIRAKKIFMKDFLWLGVFVGLISVDLLFTAIRLYFQNFAIVPSFERLQNETVVTFTTVQNGYEGLTYTHWVYHGTLLSVLALIGSLTRDVQPKHNENAIISVFVFAAAAGTLFSLAVETSGERETKVRPTKAAIIWIIAIIPVLWHLVTKFIGVFFDPKNPPKILSKLTSSIKSGDMRPLSKKGSTASVDGNFNTKSKGSNRDLLAKCKKSNSLMLIPTGNLAKKTESYQCSLSIIEPYRLFETWIIGNVVLTRNNQKRFITFSSKEPAAIAMAFSLERSVEAIVPSKLSCCEEVIHRIELKTANSVAIKLDFADPIIAGSFCAVLNEVLKK